MEKNETNITVENGIKELIIRHGEALPLKEVQDINIYGTIDAPLRFIKNRKNEPSFVVNESHVTVNKEAGSIALFVFEHCTHSDIIGGKITISEKVNSFDLQSEKYRSPEDTANFLRKKKHFFDSEAEYTNIFTSLRTFRAKVEQQIAQIKDDTGNYEQKRIQAVEHNIPKTFTIRVPIFTGTDPVKVEVEILVSKSLDVALFSTDLMQKIDQMRDEIVDDVVQNIQKECPGLLVINV
jgi:hypothetical protein